jgi:hypothetical protein
MSVLYKETYHYLQPHLQDWEWARTLAAQSVHTTRGGLVSALTAKHH